MELCDYLEHYHDEEDMVAELRKLMQEEEE